MATPVRFTTNQDIIELMTAISSYMYSAEAFGKSDETLTPGKEFSTLDENDLRERAMALICKPVIKYVFSPEVLKEGLRVDAKSSFSASDTYMPPRTLASNLVESKLSKLKSKELANVLNRCTEIWKGNYSEDHIRVAITKLCGSVLTEAREKDGMTAGLGRK